MRIRSVPDICMAKVVKGKWWIFRTRFYFKHLVKVFGVEITNAVLPLHQKSNLVEELCPGTEHPILDNEYRAYVK